MNWTKLMCADRPRMHTSKQKPNPNDLRTEFEKDYHRILTSASFRRLQDKTQVFPLDQSDYIRTRLTHSLEVSSFGRSLGQNVGRRILQEKKASGFTAQNINDISDVLQCAGLLHDIGNPPFGHFGESAIQDWFASHMDRLLYDGKPLSEILNAQMQADLTHFEGNTQALRVVSKLHFLVDENGMNLTKALLGTLIKYPGSSLEISYDKNDPDRDIKHKKMGYFYAERTLFDDIQKSTGTNGNRHPLSFLLEAADDIAYTTADIEDAVKKGLLNYAILHEELHMTCLQRDTHKVVKDLLTTLKTLYDKAIENRCENPDLYAVQNWVIAVQGKFLGAATDSFMDRYEEIMEGNCRVELLHGIKITPLLKAMQDIAYRYAFVSKPILKLEVKADSIFDFLLDRFTRAFLYETGTPLWKQNHTAVDEKMARLMSEDYLRIYRVYSEGCDEAEKLYLRMLLVTDYISGMTDGFAKRMYEELR
ncbi:MAG: deoxyguanosinetriphosphate triphosphohydrolase [Lachnospiraceae bacterium]|nr:deoxyguanosinetriphosphate triphosphohydrolase [Lachnospiraceae bacterium]